MGQRRCLIRLVLKLFNPTAAQPTTANTLTPCVKGIQKGSAQRKCHPMINGSRCAVMAKFITSNVQVHKVQPLESPITECVEAPKDPAPPQVRARRRLLATAPRGLRAESPALIWDGTGKSGERPHRDRRSWNLPALPLRWQGIPLITKPWCTGPAKTAA